MFSQSSEYALRAVILLGLSDERRGGHVIARELGVPANYLSKLLQQLCRHRILDSRKGWGGGYQLAKKPNKINVGDIVELFDGAAGPRDCILGKDRCTDEDPCPLHGYWKQIKSIHEVMTSKVTVADLVQSARVQSK
jgi:Rrf2 family protein